MFEEKLKIFIEERYPHVKFSEIGESIKPLTELFQFDSIGFVTFIVEIETLFSIQFDNSDIFNINLTPKEFLSMAEKCYNHSYIH